MKTTPATAAPVFGAPGTLAIATPARAFEAFEGGRRVAEGTLRP